MSTKELECKAIPDDARLENFLIFGQLEVRFVWNKEEGRNDIELLSELRFVLMKYGVEIIFKPGFACDGGSVPSCQWDDVSAPYATRFLLAFILHDGLYGCEYFNRKTCDWIFLELMDELSCSWLRRNKAWLAVRTFGGSVWNRHTEISRNECKQSVKMEYFEITGN